MFLVTLQKFVKQKYWYATNDTMQPTRLNSPGMVASPRMLAMVVLTSALSLASFLVLEKPK